MSNFLRYALRETVSNLWRNRLMTMAAVLTVTVSLSLVGAALYLKQGASQASNAWEKGTQVTVWILPHATKSELSTVRAQLRTSPYVENCQFWSKRRDLADAHETQPPSISDNITLANVPASVRCIPVAPGDAAFVTTQFQSFPGVLTVTAPEATIHAIETTVNWLQLILLLIALVLMVSAGVLILNTIRMAIFARRREVSVMKLVGATNWFIRIPFIAEGLIQGVIGAVLASGVVFGIQLLVSHVSAGSNPGSLLSEMRLSGWHVIGTNAVVIIVGGGIGALGSAFAVRRFLDV